LAGVTLVSDDVASLFAVPEGGWTAINKRVGLIWRFGRGNVSLFTRYLPTFGALAAASEQWKGSTFPGLVKQSGDIAGYSASAITSFTVLQAAIAGLDPHAPLPAAVQAQAQTTLDELATSSDTVAKNAKSLGDEVATFTTQNQIVDAALPSVHPSGGSDPVSQLAAAVVRNFISMVLPADTGEIDEAVGLVQGSWSAIVDDLANVTRGQIQITTQFLLSLDIASALLSWQHIRTEAQAFASFAGGQGQYLDGSYLDGLGG
jgi:hypothetical protein